MIAAKTLVPVLGVPVKVLCYGVDSLYSICEMPKESQSEHWLLTAGAANAGLLAAQILASWDAELLFTLAIFRESQTSNVLDNPDPRT